MSNTSIDGDSVRQLADLLLDTGLTEIEYENGPIRIRVTKNATVVHAAAPAMPVLAAGVAPGIGSAPIQAEPAEHPGAVKAPMVGVIYHAPEPGAPPFIRVGDRVSEGQTLCLIEAMKTFNPVRAPRAGAVVAILVDDATPVEFGEPLVIVE